MSVIKRRHFLRTSLAALPAAALPIGKLFAAVDVAAGSDIEAVTGDGRQLLLKAADVRDFAASLRGDLLMRDSAGYDTARHVWNGAFDRHPALIARCTGAADVMQAVKFAASHQLLVSVRGGGHSLSGQSVCEKGLMIDLSQMNGAHVDPARKIATVEGGALLGALDREALVHGLVTTAGTVSHTGVGGLTLGGGFGRLGRRFGLTCDNVRAIDIVTADGRFLTASGQQNQELFWGLRGGGGNFGIATSFEYQLHPVDPLMIGGELAYAWQDAPAVLKLFFESAPQMPDEMNIDAALVRLPNDTRFLTLDVCYSGPRERADKLLAPLRQIARPVRDNVVPSQYAVLQTSGDITNAAGRKYYIKGGFVQKSSPGLIDTAIAIIDDAKLPLVQAVVFPQGGGAIKRVKPNATAFAQRSAEHNVFLFSTWEDPAFGESVGPWVKANWARIEPHTYGFYVNEFNAEDAARLQTTYGANFDRLVALKSRVDPQNLFRLNANITPRKPVSG